ncbi:hypothetical protein ACNSN2_06880 [Pseudoalteromonas sp. US3C1013]|uniref:hypothetical protein n=1 Tax=unclassified Pseudoalteromonas TaxID=194690 RepID=UPI003AB22BC8
MELLERKYIRELAKQHDLRISEAISNNILPQLSLDLKDELNELTKDLSEEELKKFDLLYCQEMDALSSMQELETSKKRLEAAEIEAKTAELELNKALQESNDSKFVGYIVAFVVMFLMWVFIFGK